MELDITSHLGNVAREVTSRERDGRPARAVVARRTYDTDIDDLWDALTSAERIPRWFMPITGDLKVGGRYQLEGNAGGEITACEPPTHLALTWEFGGEVTWVEVHLSEKDGGTLLELEHVAHVDERWGEFGPGAVGIGWESGLVGLGEHLSSGASVEPAEAMAWLGSDQGKAFVRSCSDGWRDAAIADGDEPGAAQAAAARTTAAYTGEPDPGSASDAAPEAAGSADVDP
jgi:uncharacterized protein YndB with AHSA1/START domain